MRNNGLSRRQKLIIGLMALTLIAVLIALASLIRRGASTSPLATAALPAVRITVTVPSRDIPSPMPPTEVSTTPSQVGEADEVLAAREIQELGQEVGRIRELPKQQEIPLNFVGPEEMVSLLRRLRGDSEHRAFIQQQQDLLAALDLTPGANEGFPPTVQTRARNVIAFYEPLEGQIFVGPAGWDGEPPDVSLVHQYAHAYIDQHFDLLDLVDDAPNADVARARDALMEGDALAVLGLYSFGRADHAGLAELALHLSEVELTDYEDYRTSRATNDLLVFPYEQGTHFVAALLESGWWPAVNAAYLDPPVSTEQILHPEKYISRPRDLPRTARLPGLSDELEQDWRLVAEGVLGELVLRTHLDYFLPDTSEAVAAAEGWDGDLATLWRDVDDREILMVQTVWDSAEDAAEFERGYTSLIDRRLQDARPVRRPIVPLGGRWWRGDEGSAYIQREGDAVLVIWTPDTETMEQVLAAFVFSEG
jgi:hypothetical protein